MSQTIETRYTRADLVAINGEPVVLNAGCGRDDNGVGIDIHYNPDIEHDLNDGIPVADNSVDRVLCQHVLEHIENPAYLLREAHRVLRDDGELRVEIPNIGWLPVRCWLTQDMHRFWSHKTPGNDGHWLARKLGNPDERRTAHQTVWTKQLLAEHLDRAGFCYEIDGWHCSRNLTARAWPTERARSQTLHELERAAGDDLAAGDYWAQTRARIISRWVDESGATRVLDVGCGSGYLTARIADSATHRHVIGVDSNEQSIAVARRRDTSAEFHIADAFDLEYSPESFDLLLFGDVLEHFEEPQELLDATRHLLAPEGRVIVSVPAFRALYGPHDEHNNHHDRYTTKRLAAVARKAGYQLERSRYTNAVPLLPYFIYQRILRKPVPSGVRGGHNRVVEGIKQWLIRAEARVPWPAGVTLLAEFREDS